MRRPDQHALTDAASGRVTMPFLPTLAVVAVLGLASLYCPGPRRAEPAPPAAAGAVASAAFASSAPDSKAPTHRPASLAFAEVYPLAAASGPVVTGSIAASEAPVAAAGHPSARAGQRLAAVKRTCPGRRCPETPWGAEAAFAARTGSPGEGDAADGGLPAAALPFASVADALAPTARAVGEAADLLRGGASSVKGAVALAVADCLR